MSQHPRSLCIQAHSAKESNTPTGPPEAPMHSEEGSAFDFVQHIPSPITGALPATSQVEAAIIQSGGPLSAITVTNSSTKAEYGLNTQRWSLVIPYGSYLNARRWSSNVSEPTTAILGIPTTYILLEGPNVLSNDYNDMSPHVSMSKNTFRKGINPWPIGFRPNIKLLGLHHTIFQHPFHAFCHMTPWAIRNNHCLLIRRAIHFNVWPAIRSNNWPAIWCILVTIHRIGHLLPSLDSLVSFSNLVGFSTSGSQKRPAPYDFMDHIPGSQHIARNLRTQDLQPRADIEDSTSGSDSIPDSEEDVIQVWHVLKGITTSITDGDSAGPSIRFALPEGSPTEEVTLSDDWILHDPAHLVQRCVGHPRSIPTNLPPMPSGTPAFNAALDAEAGVLHHLLIDMKQMKKELHHLNERLMRDYLILETLIMNIHQRPDDLEEPDI
ncbi:hypothetical protein EI94DRAFT_1701120 [Lactarius quietus]|nr:hypothetical protein EI94DRAFT_1701120 [Lactarius quietus]